MSARPFLLRDYSSFTSIIDVEEELKLVSDAISTVRDRIVKAEVDNPAIQTSLEEQLTALVQTKKVLLQSALQDRSRHDENEVSAETTRVFPTDKFSLLRCNPKPFDAKPILLEQSVEDALSYIEREVNRRTTDTYRVSPLSITSMARSGKTTLLKQVNNKILENNKFHPIFVDFNGFSGFTQQDAESDYDAVLRWVKTSLLYDYKEAVPTITCQEQELEQYLSKAKKPVVLLVDELNALTGNNVSKDLTRLLREMFLDKVGRHLCFTSHWTLDLKDVIGKSDSPRFTHYVNVPRTQNEEEVNSILDESRQITRVQLAACLGSVGLAYSIYGLGSGFEPSVYFAGKTENITEFPVETFLNEFCFGKAEHKRMRLFDRFTTRVEHGYIQWPMCFAKEFLRKTDELQLYSLIEHAENAVNLPQTNTGLEWEYTARIALGIIARCTSFRNLTPIEARVLYTTHTHVCTYTHTSHTYNFT